MGGRQWNGRGETKTTNPLGIYWDQSEVKKVGVFTPPLAGIVISTHSRFPRMVGGIGALVPSTTSFTTETEHSKIERVSSFNAYRLPHETLPWLVRIIG